MSNMKKCNYLSIKWLCIVDVMITMIIILHCLHTVLSIDDKFTNQYRRILNRPRKFPNAFKHSPPTSSSTIRFLTSSEEDKEYFTNISASSNINSTSPSTTKTNNNSVNNQVNDEENQNHTDDNTPTDDITKYIKNILTFSTSSYNDDEDADDNKSINKTIMNSLINEMFNLENSDPMYVFVLPSDRKNRTVVLRKSHFDEPKFPNISSLERQIINSNISRLNHLIEHIDKMKLMATAVTQYLPSSNDPAATSLANTPTIWTIQQRPVQLTVPTQSEYNFNKYSTTDSSSSSSSSNDDISDDVGAPHVIEENVRTEKNFLQFMNYLNAQTIDNNNLSNEDFFKSDSSESLQPTQVPEFGLSSLPSAPPLHSTDLNVKSSEIVIRTKTVQPHSEIKYTLQVEYPQSTTAIPATTTVEPPKSSEITWKDFGLDGWIGGIKKPGYTFEKTFKNPQPTEHLPYTSSWYLKKYPLRTPVKNEYNNFRSSFNSEELFKTPPTSTSTLTTQYPSNHRQPKQLSQSITNQHVHHQIPTASDEGGSKSAQTTEYPSQDFWDIPMQIPPELMELLKDENLKYNNNTTNNVSNLNSKPIWPITSSRSSHKDDDVFIARANNPFGHSTKWAFSNSSGRIQESRTKRGALILYSMVKCSTGCDPIIYKGYGCYCGFLGSGRTLDGIDRCCKMHDYCYERASCPMFLEYFVPYLWKCYRGRPLCAIDHGEWGGPGSCASRLCECDQRLSKCLSKFYCPRKRAVCTSSPLRLLQNVIML